MDRIKTVVSRILPEIIGFRRELHRNPELSGKEFKTSALIREKLKKTGFELLPPYLETDVTAFFDSGKPGKNIVLRADIDALTQTEVNDAIGHRSVNPGCMHGCGHDGHVAMLYGTALVLDQLRDELTGSVKLIFQPGEEVGALGHELVKKGVLDSPRPDLIFAVHGMNGIPEGVLSSRKGAITAGADYFALKVKGKGGHASMPDQCVDSLLIACQIVNQWQSVVSRAVAPYQPAVLGVGNFQCDGAWNIIPSEVKLEGTVRYYDREAGQIIPEKMLAIAEGIAHGMGATVEFDYQKPYIPTVNDPLAYEFARDMICEKLGASSFQELEKRLTIGEDFSFYLDRYPGALFLLGLGEEHLPLHHRSFDFNDAALTNGICFLAGCKYFA